MLPPPDVEYLLAYRLLADPNPLPKSALLELMGRPRRYNELRDTLKVKNDNQLTRALRYLQEDGLVYQRLDPSARPATFSYELGPLGRLVLIKLLQMLPAGESARILLRGKIAQDVLGAEA